MKILSYNICVIKDAEFPFPKWEIRQKNIERILNELLVDCDIKICCFQEVNKDNFDLLDIVLKKNNFKR